MPTVTLHNKTSFEISQIIHELKHKGLIANEHYEYKFFPAHWEQEPPHRQYDKKTEFTFKEEKYATWVLLKYS
jgi:hypothetical protein